ncbi:hypothetical protein N475_13500 [Pseudoalteromonas luteoviolacea DSM 6061]|uniref:Uncharacterized protein n=1 Tax=Pseudoalteromonas luteoviolacea DSM 6061 TaxID=1365250 RepID=A0A166X7H9_9GAMM|nr:hypothetical protein N475_13500 [Pseudoalteromonas luteoviolacea DSM 6061]MBE0385705.1 hypothetical protein [Pseudoalteromonas luteoviolacea DSM 6061]
MRKKVKDKVKYLSLTLLFIPNVSGACWPHLRGQHEIMKQPLNHAKWLLDGLIEALK